MPPPITYVDCGDVDTRQARCRRARVYAWHPAMCAAPCAVPQQPARDLTGFPPETACGINRYAARPDVQQFDIKAAVTTHVPRAMHARIRHVFAISE
jgi:hypothetical protein